MTKVLVGVDLSQSGYVWLLTRAADLAASLQGTIDLVYIADKITAEQKDTADSQLRDLMAHIRGEFRGTAMVVDGKVKEALGKLSNDYDVLVVGPREPAGIRKLFEKPIAISVIATVNCPVFVPRVEQPKTAFPRLLMAVDFDFDKSDSRFAMANQWAAMFGAKIDIVYCSQSLSKHAEERVARDINQDQLALVREERQKKLQALVDDSLNDAIRGRAIVHEAAPGPGIVELSKDYDIVLVGTSDVKQSGLILGSVSVHVVRNAHCDVLTLP